MAERDETFLARWSRRKQAARAAEREQEPQHSAPPGPTRAADANAPEPPDATDRTPALPDPSTLDASSDFSVFLGRDVPIETQRAALRRLWRLDPIYNRVDGLDDYCADFTDQATVVQGLRTAYRVGRGMLEQTGEPAEPADAAPPASADPGPATPEATSAPPPRGQSGSGDLLAPAEAGSLQSAATARPASDNPTSIARVPPDEGAAAGRAATEPTRAGARSAGGRVRRLLPKRS